MPPEIGPIGDNRASRVQPINWTEKVELNERRISLPPQQRPSGPVIDDTFIPSEELVPRLKLYNGASEFAGDAPSAPRQVREPRAAGASPARDASVAPNKVAPDAPVAAKAIAPEQSGMPKSPTTLHADAADASEVAPASVASQPKIPVSIAETATTDLQAKRIALINAGTADSITDLASVNDELAKRGQFRSALDPAARVDGAAPGNAATEWVPGQSKTVKLSPDQLPPEARPTGSPNGFASPLARVATFGLGALGVVGGLLQLNNGVNEIRTGYYGEGAVTSMAGLCNTTAGGAAFFSSGAFANALATRAGGFGAMLDGGLQLYKGYNSGNDVQLLDGGVRTGLGATMLAGGPTGWCAGSAYAGWSLGRFIGERKVSGNNTVDDVVTQGLYNLFFAP